MTHTTTQLRLINKTSDSAPVVVALFGRNAVRRIPDCAWKVISCAAGTESVVSYPHAVQICVQDSNGKGTQLTEHANSAMYEAVHTEKGLELKHLGSDNFPGRTSVVNATSSELKIWTGKDGAIFQSQPAIRPGEKCQMLQDYELSVVASAQAQYGKPLNPDDLKAAWSMKLDKMRNADIVITGSRNAYRFSVENIVSIG